MRGLLLALLLAASLAAASVVRVSRTEKVKHGYVFVDDKGRSLLFHGVNAVYKIPPWRPEPTGFDPVTTLSERDAEILRDLGFNVVRLGVMWPGAEPRRGVYDRAYLRDIRRIVDILGAKGIYTLLDFHQDLGSRFFCGEGFPDWAIYVRPNAHKFPWPVRGASYPVDPQGYPTLEYCLERAFFQYYITVAVGAAFQSVYENVNGTLDAFASFWREVARIAADSPHLLGYEIINEPSMGDAYKHPTLLVPGRADKVNLWPMYERVHKAIREVDDNGIIFFEKSIINAVGPLGFPAGGPGGEAYRDRNVYAYHNYCGTVDRSGNPRSVMLCSGQQWVQWEQEMHDIDVMKCGSFMTEFGAVGGNNTASIKELNWLLERADTAIQSWAYWQYKSYHDITTASNEIESLFWPDGSFQQDKVDALSRAYAQATAGRPTVHKFDPAKLELTLEYVTSGARAAHPTEIYYPPVLRKGGKLAVDIAPAGAATWEVASPTLLHVRHSASLAAETKITVRVYAAK